MKRLQLLAALAVALCGGIAQSTTIFPCGLGFTPCINPPPPPPPMARVAQSALSLVGATSQAAVPTTTAWVTAKGSHLVVPPVLNIYPFGTLPASDQPKLCDGGDECTSSSTLKPTPTSAPFATFGEGGADPKDPAISSASLTLALPFEPRSSTPSYVDLLSERPGSSVGQSSPENIENTLTICIASPNCGNGDKKDAGDWISSGMSSMRPWATPVLGTGGPTY